jgi:hypothetical protein
MKVGDTVSWHIRPEVHVEHGGYLDTPRERGRIVSVGPGYLVDTGRPIKGYCLNEHRVVSDTFKIFVSRYNPSLRLEEK